MSDEHWKERLEAKIDKIADTQGEMKIDLALHIEGVKQTRELIALTEKGLNAKLSPVIQHVEKIETWINVGKISSKVIFKVLGAIVLLGTGTKGILALLEWLK